MKKRAAIVRNVQKSYCWVGKWPGGWGNLKEKWEKMGESVGKWGRESALLHWRLNGMFIGNSVLLFQQQNSKLWIATLPLPYVVAHRVLAVLAMLCDVERCFSSFKWVRDDRQQEAKCESYDAAVMRQYKWDDVLILWIECISVFVCCCIPRFPKAGYKESLVGDDTPTDG